MFIMLSACIYVTKLKQDFTGLLSAVRFGGRENHLSCAADTGLAFSYWEVDPVTGLIFQHYSIKIAQ
jgi:hypothetical protein